MRNLPLSIVVSASQAISCTPSPSTPAPVATCSATQPAAGAAVDSANVLKLVGTFDIVLVNTVGGWAPPQWRLQLSLRPTDSTPTYSFGMRPGPRPLYGEAVYEGDSTHRQVGTIMVKQMLYVGPGIDGTDWSGNALSVNHFTAEGFRGTWYHSGGIGVVIDPSTRGIKPDPKGIFCARRLPPGGA